MCRRVSQQFCRSIFNKSAKKVLLHHHSPRHRTPEQQFCSFLASRRPKTVFKDLGGKPLEASPWRSDDAFTRWYYISLKTFLRVSGFFFIAEYLYRRTLGRQKSKLEKSLSPFCTVFPTTKMILQNDTMPSNKKREVPRRRKGCDVYLVSVRFRHWIRRRKEGRRGQDGWRFWSPGSERKEMGKAKKRVCLITFLPCQFLLRYTYSFARR